MLAATKFSTRDVSVAQQSTVQRGGDVPTVVLEIKTSSHPSYHTSLKVTTDLSCPVQGSLLFSEMGS